MRYVGARLPRLEDARLLTGQGQFVDDIRLPGALEAAVLRSPYAHARIGRVDAAAARALPGVLAVYTAADLGDLARPFPILQPHPGLTAAVNQGPLAGSAVRYVGEPIALVVAEDRYVAEDAAEQIEVEYEPLPAVVDVEAALAPGAPQVHAAAPGNVSGAYRQGVGDVDAAFARAAHVFRQRLRIQRGSAQPMETRGVAARPADGGLTVWSSTQRPYRLRTILADFLGLPPERIRAVAPDVGGAFGAKGNFYPEELLVPLAAWRLGRPVRWVEDRREHFVATVQERTQLFDVAVATAADGRLLGLKVAFLHDLGAYAPYGFVLAQNAANHMIGPYRIPAVSIAWQGVYTHLTPTAAYRGAGRPQGVFVIERTLDLVARELGLDPAEVRRRNLVAPGELPYDTGIVSGRGRLVYDSGDYPACQATALAKLDYAGWREEQVRLRAQGRRVGIGIANYIEVSTTQPYEGARVRVTPTGEIWVGTGAGSQGQGHRTALAQICADVLGVDTAEIAFADGDTDLLEKGIGTFGSRTAILVGNAVRVAAAEVRERALALAARLLEAAAADLEWLGTAVAVRGVPARRLTLAELAAAAAGEGALLDVTHYYSTAGMHVANGTHAAVVEVHPDTGFVTFLRYVVMHDCGIVINPLLVDGQVYGGLAQSLGGALYERLVYDEAGQLLTGTMMDYLLPTATEIPEVDLHHMETASPHNPLGFKGAGEGGALPPYAVIAAAVEDAVGMPVRELPLTPVQVRAWVQAAIQREAEDGGAGEESGAGPVR